MPDNSDEIIEAPLAREQRWAGWAAFLGLGLGWPVLFFMQPAASLDLYFLLGLIHCLFGLMLVYTLFWRLRVDDKGVHVRSLLKRRTWPWALFEQGIARQSQRMAFWFPGSPRLSFDLAVAQEPAASRAFHLCLCHWNPPKPLRLPPSARVTTSHLTSVCLDEKGMQIRRFRSVHYPWETVEKVILLQTNPDDESFIHLRIFAGGRMTWLKTWGEKGESFYGAQPEMIAAYIKRYTSPDKLVICTPGEPRSFEEGKERLLLVRKEVRERTRMFILFLAVGAFAALTCAQDLLRSCQGFSNTLLLAGGVLSYSLMGFVLVQQYRAAKRGERELLDRIKACPREED